MIQWLLRLSPRARFCLALSVLSAALLAYADLIAVGSGDPSTMGSPVLALQAGVRDLPWAVYPLAALLVAAIGHLLFVTTRSRITATVLGTLAVVYSVMLPELWTMAVDFGAVCFRQAIPVLGCGTLSIHFVLMILFIVGLWAVNVAVPSVLLATGLHGGLLLAIGGTNRILNWLAVRPESAGTQPVPPAVAVAAGSLETGPESRGILPMPWKEHPRLDTAGLAATRENWMRLRDLVTSLRSGLLRKAQSFRDSLDLSGRFLWLRTEWQRVGGSAPSIDPGNRSPWPDFPGARAPGKRARALRIYGLLCLVCLGLGAASGVFIGSLGGVRWYIFLPVGLAAALAAHKIFAATGARLAATAVGTILALSILPIPFLAKGYYLAATCVSRWEFAGIPDLETRCARMMHEEQTMHLFVAGIWALFKILPVTVVATILYGLFLAGTALWRGKNRKS